MVSDETAYRKYLAGDEAAAQLLVERYGDALTLYINGVLGDIHEAEDLMIEAFAHIFARERPIQDGCFKAYLYKTGRNLALRCKTRRLSLLFQKLFQLLLGRGTGRDWIAPERTAPAAVRRTGQAQKGIPGDTFSGLF